MASRITPLVLFFAFISTFFFLLDILERFDIFSYPRKDLKEIFPFVEVPIKGFKTVKEMEEFARSSFPAGGSVIEVKIGGDRAWVMTRYLSFDQSVSDMNFYREGLGGLIPFYSKPMTLDTLRIEQKDDWVLVSRFNTKVNKYENAIAFYKILSKDREN